MPIYHSHPPHILQAKQAAIDAGADPETVETVLNIAAELYHNSHSTEHKKMTPEAFAALGVLYKYRTANDERHWQILENQVLWFPTPSSFNDPFDANIGIHYDSLSGAAQIKNFTNTTRVFCVCPHKDNILLWSHYANDHAGFAIGFDPMQLLELCQTVGWYQTGYVDYRSTYPIMTRPEPGDREAQEEVITTIMNVKSDIWSYEKEVRMIMFNGPPSAAFESRLVKEVVIGCKISDAHRDRMLDIMDRKYPHAIVYQAKLSPEAFALEFDKLRG